MRSLKKIFMYDVRELTITENLIGSIPLVMIMLSVVILLVGCVPQEVKECSRHEYDTEDYSPKYSPYKYYACLPCSPNATSLSGELYRRYYCNPMERGAYNSYDCNRECNRLGYDFYRSGDNIKYLYCTCFDLENSKPIKIW